MYSGPTDAEVDPAQPLDDYYCPNVPFICKLRYISFSIRVLKIKSISARVCGAIADDVKSEIKTLSLSGVSSTPDRL